MQRIRVLFKKQKKGILITVIKDDLPSADIIESALANRCLKGIAELCECQQEQMLIALETPTEEQDDDRTEEPQIPQFNEYGAGGAGAGQNPGAGPEGTFKAGGEEKDDPPAPAQQAPEDGGPGTGLPS